MAADVYDLIPDLTGVGEEDYESYDLARLKETLRSVDPERLETMAVTWGEVGTRLDEIGTEIRQRAVETNNAWRGTPSSVSCQQKLRMEHGSARSLADTARRMQTTVARLAEVAREMREYEKQLPLTESEAATQEAMDNGGGVISRVQDFLTGPDDDFREIQTALARVRLRQFHEQYQQILREEAPNRIAVDLPEVNVAQPEGDIRGGPPPSPVSSPTGGYPSLGSAGSGQPWNVAASSAGGRSGHFWPRPDLSSPLADSSVPAPADADVGDTDDPREFDAGGSRSWEVDDSFRRPDGTTLAGFHTGGSGAGGGSFATGSGGSAGSGFGGSGSSPGVGSGGGSSSGGHVVGPPAGRGVSGFGGSSGGSPTTAGRGMMPPPMMGAPPGGKDDEERERQSWMAEESNVWGLDDDVVPPVIGAPDPADEERPRRRRPS